MQVHKLSTVTLCTCVCECVCGMHLCLHTCGMPHMLQWFGGIRMEIRTVRWPWPMDNFGLHGSL